jgi:hypothetical protein
MYRNSSAVTDLHEFPDRAHSLTMDSGWREVADVVLAWLAEHGLAPGRPAPDSIPVQREDFDTTTPAASVDPGSTR